MIRSFNVVSICLLGLLLAEAAGAQFGGIRLPGRNRDEPEVPAPSATQAARTVGGAAASSLQGGDDFADIPLGEGPLMLSGKCLPDGNEDMTAEEIRTGIRDQANGWYTSNDEGFKDQVNNAKRGLLGRHAQYAYETNRSAHSEIVYVMEDRFRVFSGLYDNLMVQDLVNEIGQEVIPNTSEKFFTFKLIADPIPFAESLVTGTVHVSTGLVAMLDNKAQLAFILGHEAAHIYLEHQQERMKLDLAARRLRTTCAEKQATNRAWWQLGLGVGGAIAGNKVGGALGSKTLGTLVGGVGGLVAANMITRQREEVVEWNEEEEAAADELAFEWLLRAKLNVREAPRLYLALEEEGRKDARVGLAFLGDQFQARKRHDNVMALIENPKYAAELEGPLGGDGPEFQLLMAEVKRDNGIMAYQYDMLEVARRNLGEAAAVRDTDPTAQYFYGKVLKMVGRTEEDRQASIKAFARAMEVDTRNQNFGAFLHRAVALMEAESSDVEKAQSIGMLQQYIDGYMRSRNESARINGQVYPPHLETIYDYLSRMGEYEWKPAGIENNFRDVDIMEVKDPLFQAPAAGAAAEAVKTAAPKTN